MIEARMSQKNQKPVNLKRLATDLLKAQGSVTITFGTNEVKVVNNKKSLARMFELAELFDGIKTII